MRRFLVIFAVLQGCAASTGAVANAALNTAVGVGAAAGSRAAGGCFAACPDGTACNRATGYCDAIPCRGACAPNERCEPGAVERCVPAAEVNLKIEERPAERKTPQ